MILEREQVLKLVQKDNSFKYEILKKFSEIIGFNLDDVLSRIVSQETILKLTF